jgi:2-keto-4-pentenoate hydratase/2-oxohepta-3-ene-1,7-dioic acid hydratase in catechol pathway
MRIAAFDDGGVARLGRVEGDQLRPLQVEDGRLALHLRAAGGLQRLEEAPTLGPRPLSEISLLPPVTGPKRIICAGANFEAHRKEMGRERPSHPMLFVRFASSVVGHRAPLIQASGKFDYEGELACIIGRRVRRLRTDEAWDTVAGFSIFNDGTARDWQRHTAQFTPGKNFDASGAFGPYFVSRDEIEDITGSTLRTWVNDELRQEGRLDDLTFGVPDLLAYITHFTTLDPGDVVVCGTPSGVGAGFDPPRFLSPGDRVRIEIEGVGVLENEVTEDFSSR